MFLLQFREYRLDDVVIAAPDRTMGLFLRNQDFVQLFAGSNTDDSLLDIPILDKFLGKVDHVCRRYSRNVSFATLRLPQRRKDCVNRIFQA